jgi:hypothetical protein
MEANTMPRCATSILQAVASYVLVYAGNQKQQFRTAGATRRMRGVASLYKR